MGKRVKPRAGRCGVCAFFATQNEQDINYFKKLCIAEKAHTPHLPARGFTNNSQCDTIPASRMFSTLYRTILDALFPLSPAEQELFSWSPEEALGKLTLAPDFSGLAVPLPTAKSVFAYKDERVSKLVWNIKYKKSTQAVKIGGFALYKELTRQNLQSVLVVPIPITAKRRRERGYNQCELLTDEIERLQNQIRTHTFIFEKNLLTRIGDSSEQKLKDRNGRVESAHGIFVVRSEIVALYEKNTLVVVIDDVITTGSTVHEALETLKKAGFKTVLALSLAH